jgi:hypothetical protein
MRCPDFRACVEHPPHWYTVMAGNITVAGGECPGYPDRESGEPIDTKQAS